MYLPCLVKFGVESIFCLVTSELLLSEQFYPSLIKVCSFWTYDYKQKMNGMMCRGNAYPCDCKQRFSDRNVFVSYGQILRKVSLKPVQVPSLPLSESYILKKIIFLNFIYKTALWDSFGTASERTSHSDFKNEFLAVTCYTS